MVTVGKLRCGKSYLLTQRRHKIDMVFKKTIIVVSFMYHKLINFKDTIPWSLVDLQGQKAIFAF